jgi:type IV pilus biogenesis protein CpaD/CtpE
MSNTIRTRDHQNRGTTSPVALSACVALMLLLSACVTQPPHLSDNFGNAVRQNIAAQVINPDAAGPDESDRIDGQAAERALESQRARSNQSNPESLVTGAGGGN